MKIPKKFTAKQKLLFEYGMKHPYSLLCADPRLGKTPVAIYLQKNRNVNCLVICPSYLIVNWKNEIKKWSPESSVTIFQKGKDIYEVSDTDFVVTSYNLVQKAEHLFEWCDQVIIDEAHNLKSISTNRSQFIHRALFENSVKYFHGLTGTPIKNRVMEFYSLLALAEYNPRNKESKFLAKYPDELSFADDFSYRQTYKIPVTTKRGAKFRKEIVKFTGLKNVGQLKNWLKDIYIRIRADASDLPPLVEKDILVSDFPNIKLLQAFEDYFNSGEETGSINPEMKVAAAMEKVPFTIEYAENLMEYSKCCLIYSDHVEPITKIAKHFKVSPITGAMSGKQRIKMVEDFQNGKTNILCATIGSLKEGANLFRSKDIIFNDYCWVPGDLSQVINRVRAIGEKESRTVHKILGSPQDLKIWAVLMEKQKVINAAT